MRLLGKLKEPSAVNRVRIPRTTKFSTIFKGILAERLNAAVCKTVTQAVNIPGSNPGDATKSVAGVNVASLALNQCGRGSSPRRPTILTGLGVTAAYAALTRLAKVRLLQAPPLGSV